MEHFYFLPKWLVLPLMIGAVGIFISSIIGWLPEHHWSYAIAHFLVAIVMFDMVLAVRRRSKPIERKHSN